MKLKDLGTDVTREQVRLVFEEFKIFLKLREYAARAQDHQYVD